MGVSTGLTSESVSPTRVVVAARLSRVQNGEQGRIERDDALAQRWAEGRGDVEIVAVSQDAGVSGAISPFDRPSLGPWLTKPALRAQYDEIVASTLDRLGRNARDLQDLRKWADKHGKSLRLLNPELTYPTPEGTAGIPHKMMWELLGVLAEAELEATRERYAAARKHLIDNGSFVGKPPWGFQVVGGSYNKSLAPDPALVPYLKRMIFLAMQGDTYINIARYLESEGAPTTSGGKWTPTSVRNILVNPALMGRRYENGNVVAKFDSLLSPTQFAALQDEIANRPGKRGPTGPDTAMLRGIAFCEKCGGPMYRHNSKSKRKDGTFSLYTVYRCKGPDTSPSRCGNAIPLKELESFVHQWFTEDGAFAGTEIMETVVTPGDDHADAIAEIDQDIRELHPGDPDYLERVTTLHGERSCLMSLPSEPATVEERPTGRTVGDVWSSITDEQRRRFMLSAEMKVYCYSNSTVRAQGDGRRQNTAAGPVPAAGPMMLRNRMVIPRGADWGEPTEREIIYVTGDPSRIQGALANLLDGQEGDA